MMEFRQEFDSRVQARAFVAWLGRRGIVARLLGHVVVWEASKENE